jgi:predicted AAA+ superfamily ATPase
VKAPKLYFYDTGLACRLMGIQSERQLTAHRSRGALFETWAVGELLKQRLHRGRPRNLFFWRDKTGNEVDILIDQGDRLDPVEIKSGQTITPDFFKGLNRWLDLATGQESQPWLIYGGSSPQNRQKVHIIPWQMIDQLGTSS